MAAPAPRVFTTRQGVEGFSARFFVEWRDKSGAGHSLELTPEVYANLRGPYNRRNVFGATLAGGSTYYAPDARLRPMWDAVASRALCGDAPLLRELGVDPANIDGRVRLWLQPRTGIAPIVMEAPCR